MSVLVVYESMFGNTRRVATAVADALRDRGADVDAREVADAPVRLPGDVDLLVVGAPTHAFGLPTPGSRVDAARRGNGRPLVSSGPGVREWVRTVQPVPPGTVRLAAFDTRTSSAHLPSRAGSSVRRALGRKGFETSTRTAWFGVTGMTGPVSPGEVERAREWAVTLPVPRSTPQGPAS